MTYHSVEIAAGKRFEFGKNWSSFLKEVDDKHIAEAEKSLKQMLGMNNLNGKSFLDIGSGSGLFSLAAKRLGASVLSFDYDPQSVACTSELKKKFYPEDDNWIVEEGTVLDTNYLKTLAQYDIVYSWGVLHHTGAMWQALENAQMLVKNGGYLFISIYNDQGSWSDIWKRIKKIYNKLPKILRLPFALLVMVPREIKSALYALLILQPGRYVRQWTGYKNNRGMNRWHDIIDWIGGYPFEVAKPEEIYYFFKDKEYVLEKLKTCAGGISCNEYVFRKRT